MHLYHSYCWSAEIREYLSLSCIWETYQCQVQIFDLFYRLFDLAHYTCGAPLEISLLLIALAYLHFTVCESIFCLSEAEIWCSIPLHSSIWSVSYVLGWQSQTECKNKHSQDDVIAHLQNHCRVPNFELHESSFSSDSSIISHKDTSSQHIMHSLQIHQSAGVRI